MFYLYATFLDATPIAEFSTYQAASNAGSKWFVGTNWVIRDTPRFNFYKTY
jgi:hypothetical protein